MIDKIEINDKNQYFISNEFVNDQFFGKHEKIYLYKVSNDTFYYINPVTKHPYY